MDKVECGICWDGFEESDIRIKCASKFCNIKVCRACIIQIINQSFQERQLVLCSCKSPYSIESIPVENQKRYMRCCLRHLSTLTKDQISTEIQTESIIDKIRKEKLSFIKEFPEGITFIAGIVFASRIAKVNKTNVTAKTKKLSEYKKKCLGLTCSGKLDESYTCILCECVFCKECEKYKTDGHTCKLIDVESVKTVNTFIKCPTCNVSVEKMSGCDHIKCGTCGTHFNYTTGDIMSSDHTPHNHAIPMIETQVLSQVYKNNISSREMRLLVDFEQFYSIKQPNMNTIISAIKSVRNIEKKSQKAAKIRIAKMYVSYLEKKMMFLQYRQTAQEIEYLLSEKKRVYPTLDKYIRSRK